MKKNTIKITLLISYFSIIFFIMMTTTKALIGAYFFIKKGTFYFSLEDIILSAKSGIAAGIPLGFGSWVLTKIRTNKNEQ